MRCCARSMRRRGRAPPNPYLWAPGGLTARRADGREFLVEATLSHVAVSGQRLHTLILRDVDERRRSEAELRRLHQEAAYLQEEIRAVHNADDIVGQSRALRQVLDKVGLVADTESSVLICGETGTGKELIARAVHARSQRAHRPLDQSELRGAAHRSDRERALRPRARRLHRRHRPSASAASSSPTAARSFSTRSATCRWRCRSSCCACCRSASSSASAARRRSPSTCA